MADKFLICPRNSSESQSLTSECPLCGSRGISQREHTPGMPRTNLILFSLKLLPRLPKERGRYSTECVQGERRQARSLAHLHVHALSNGFQSSSKTASPSLLLPLSPPVPSALPDTLCSILESPTFFVLWPLPVPLPWLDRLATTHLFTVTHPSGPMESGICSGKGSLTPRVSELCQP